MMCCNIFLFSRSRGSKFSIEKIRIIITTLKVEEGLQKTNIFSYLVFFNQIDKKMKVKSLVTERYTLLFVCLLLHTLHVGYAQKPRDIASFEIILPEIESTTIVDNKRINDFNGMPVAIHNIGYVVQADDPEAMARQFLNENHEMLGITSENITNELRLHAVRESAAGTVVRFRQHYQGLAVNKSEITIAISPDYRVTNVANSFRPDLNLTSISPAITAAQARTTAHQLIGLTGALQYDEVDLVIHDLNGVTRLAYLVQAIAAAPIGEWHVLVNAQTGVVFGAEDKAFYHHPKHHHAPQPMKKLPKFHPPMSMLVAGTGKVFDPDPMSSANATYGENGYVDNNDGMVQAISDEIVTVDLLEITLENGVYRLESPYARVDDTSAPNDGIFTQNSPDFLYDRSEDPFEAVNCFYHTDASMRYLNDDLQLNIVPYQYTTGVGFDPHALNGNDNAQYSSGTGQMSFGEGGVDDAEDSDVVHHELGHGIHDWVTSGGLSNSIDGLSEGQGDYWAQSYNRALGLWDVNDPAYQWVFNWDGHNEFFSGRVTNSDDLYPVVVPVVGIHAAGQIWSTALMKIYDANGRRKTDIMSWEGLGMTNSTSTQNDAANSAYQAALNMNCTNNELIVIYDAFTDANYVLNYVRPMPDNDALAVQLTHFSGKKEGQHTYLRWQTASETASDYFVVERSANGVDFTPTSTQSAAGTSTKTLTYEWIDQKPLKGINFYRLKSVSKDGSSTYSQVISFRFDEVVSVSVFPNPMTNQLQLTYQEVGSKSLKVQLVDVAGQLVYQQNWETADAVTPLIINTAPLPVGVYWLQINDGARQWSEKVVKR